MTVQPDSVLRRLVNAGKKSVDHGVMTPVSGLRLALSRAAQDVVRVPMTGGEVEDLRVTLTGMADALPSNGLWVLLHGPGAARGLICADPSLLSGFVQGLTTGHVSGAQVADRAPTRTDSILVQKVLTCILDTLADRLDGHEDLDWVQGFQPRDRITDPARLPHLLPDIVYRALSMQVDIANGLRAGRLVLLLPRLDRKKRTAAGGGTDSAEFTAALRRAVESAPVELHAVLHRMTLPVSQLNSLEEGMMLTLPKSALANVKLFGDDGTEVARGKLGQSNGWLAVRLAESNDAGGASVDAVATAETTSTTVIPKPDAAPDHVSASDQPTARQA